MLGGNAGNADAGRLDRQDFVDALALKQACPFGAHLVVQRHVALVVEEVVDFQDVALTDDAVLANAVFELLHVCPPDDERVETIVHHIATSGTQDIPAGCSFTYTPRSNGVDRPKRASMKAAARRLMRVGRPLGELVYVERRYSSSKAPV